MYRKIFIGFVMSMILAGAAASNTAKPVLIAMAVLSLFVISIAANGNETKDEKP